MGRMPDKSRIREALREEASREVPEDMTLWPQLQEELRPQASNTRLFRSRSAAGERTSRSDRPRTYQSMVRRSSPAMAFAVIALLLIWGVGAFLAGMELGAGGEKTVLPYPSTVPVSGSLDMADALLSQTMQTTNLAPLRQADLIQALNVSGTINDYTVTLKQAYADANRIVVGYTVENRSGALNASGTVTAESFLTSMDGRQFSSVYEANSANGEGISAHVAVYDASMLDAISSGRNLDLSLKVHLGGEPKEANSQTFDFSIPVNTAGTKVYYISQTVEASGVTMTLDRLVVSASAVQAIVRIDEPEGGRNWTQLDASVTAGPQRRQDSPLRLKIYDRQRSFELPVDPSGKPGEWTIAITNLYSTEPGTPNVRGQWVFTFTLPEDAQP